MRSIKKNLLFSISLVVCSLSFNTHSSPLIDELKTYLEYVNNHDTDINKPQLLTHLSETLEDLSNPRYSATFFISERERDQPITALLPNSDLKYYQVLVKEFPFEHEDIENTFFLDDDLETELYSTEDLENGVYDTETESNDYTFWSTDAPSEALKAEKKFHDLLENFEKAIQEEAKCKEQENNSSLDVYVVSFSHNSNPLFSSNVVLFGDSDSLFLVALSENNHPVLQTADWGNTQFIRNKINSISSKKFGSDWLNYTLIPGSSKYKMSINRLEYKLESGIAQYSQQSPDSISYSFDIRTNHPKLKRPVPLSEEDQPPASKIRPINL